MTGNEAVRHLRALAEERALGCEVDSVRLIQAGLTALLAGLDTPSVRALASLASWETEHAPVLFEQVLDELGITVCLTADPDAVRWELARSWATSIVDGSCDPGTGATMIWSQAAEPLNYPEKLQAMVGWASAWEDRDEEIGDSSAEDLDTEIIHAARELLAVLPPPPWTTADPIPGAE
ncbi:hypothetical protein GCM10010302_75280 [Streptomyces polychromogenes]|uniref:Uncharacterized protein n=1 Tax=Streptomyces polychromogenes TaxID=67342 RepID=A0ABP3FV38_9ACTN